MTGERARVRATPDGVRFAVRVTPRGGRDAIEGWQDDAAGQSSLKLRVRAVAEDGKANDAVIALLARTLKLPKTALRLLTGAQSRTKMIEVPGAGPELTARLLAIGEKQ